MIVDIEKLFNYLLDLAKIISPFIIILFGIIGFFLKDKVKEWSNSLIKNTKDIEDLKNKFINVENKCIITQKNLVSEDKCSECKRLMEEDVNEAIDKFEIIISKIDNQEKKITDSVNGLLNVVLILCRGILIICRNEELDCNEVQSLEKKINEKLVSTAIMCDCTKK